MSYRYRKVDESKVPARVRDGRWDVPRHHQGQIVEYAYSATDWRGITCSAESGSGATYRRIYDRSDGSVTYERRVSVRRA